MDNKILKYVVNKRLTSDQKTHDNKGMEKVFYENGNLKKCWNSHTYT